MRATVTLLLTTKLVLSALIIGVTPLFIVITIQIVMIKQIVQLLTHSRSSLHTKKTFCEYILTMEKSADMMIQIRPFDFSNGCSYYVVTFKLHLFCPYAILSLVSVYREMV